MASLALNELNVDATHLPLTVASELYISAPMATAVSNLLSPSSSSMDKSMLLSLKLDPNIDEKADTRFVTPSVDVVSPFKVSFLSLLSVMPTLNARPPTFPDRSNFASGLFAYPSDSSDTSRFISSPYFTVNVSLVDAVIATDFSSGLYVTFPLSFTSDVLRSPRSPFGSVKSNSLSLNASFAKSMPRSSALPLQRTSASEFCAVTTRENVARASKPAMNAPDNMRKPPFDRLNKPLPPLRVANIALRRPPPITKHAQAKERAKLFRVLALRATRISFELLVPDVLSASRTRRVPASTSVSDGQSEMDRF